jgi:putative component of membrane protein insertase Oxa1/YidC/SpoIIIJ protein YidD
MRSRRWLIAALFVVLGSPLLAERIRTGAALSAIHAYQAVGSPVVHRLGVRCRFTTSCSHYAEAAIRRHGAFAGLARSAYRVARCGPWTPAGTVDQP